ncbi:MAG: response regulator transcription factor [Treponema sp.]|jgi:two-component system phosphate regulon response regulator PhoB|nr:response regulator transcription factor [Treponema sp.]
MHAIPAPAGPFTGTMNKKSILIIEDDLDIQDMLAFAMQKEGWILRMAASGEDALRLLKQEAADCIILDIMLPGMDGLRVLKKLKMESLYRSIPVIITTARGEEADIVAGLELGADDYVVKPYSPKVLIARIRAALRRLEEQAAAASPQSVEPSRWQQGQLSLDSARHEAHYGETLLELSATEFALLQYFLSNPERVYSRNQLIAAIRGPDYPVTERSVDVQILALRKKLGPAGGMIETIRGVGYRFKGRMSP